MNLSNFNLLKEDNSSYEIGHPSGRKLKVEKSKLSKKAHEAIQKLCAGGSVKGYDDGGQIPVSLQANPIPEQLVADNQPQQQVAQLDQPMQSQGGAFGSWDQNPSPAPSVTPPPDPLQQRGQSMEDLYNKEESDIKSGVAAQGAAGKEQAAAYDQYAKDVQSKLKDPQALLADSKAKDDQLLNAYQTQKLDPDRYIHNMSTGSKIISGIALALGGLGAKQYGGQNPAMNVLQSAINNDIDAQKNDQQKSLNLFHMNHQAYEDQNQANLATQNQLWTGVQSKVLAAQARAQDPMARARANQLLDQIEQQKIQNRLQMGLMSGKGSGQADPLNLVPNLVPPEHQKQAITEIGQAKAAVQSEDQFMKLFDQAAKDTRPATGLSTTSALNTVPLYHPASIKNLNLLADPLIHDNEGRINELEQQHVQQNFPQWGDSDETVAKKRVALQDFINHKKEAPTAKTFGINVENFGSTSSNPVTRLTPQQRSYYDWARSNPRDPRSQVVLKKLGVTNG